MMHRVIGAFIGIIICTAILASIIWFAFRFMPIEVAVGLLIYMIGDAVIVFGERGRGVEGNG